MSSEDRGVQVEARPVRIQRKRTKGWRMPEGAVYVGRPSRWGNPFAAQRVPRWPRWGGPAPWQVVDATGKVWPHDESRRPILGRAAAETEHKRTALAAAVDLFALHVGPFGNYEYDDEDLSRLRDELSGRDLACWCPLDQPCHADVLLELANPDLVTAEGP